MTADPERIYERVSRNKSRPLLAVADPHASMLELMAKRQALYDATAEFRVDSTQLETRQVAELIATEARRVFGWRPATPTQS